MRTIRTNVVALCLTALGIGCLGCGTEQSGSSPAAEATEEQKSGLIDRIFEPDTVSLTVPAGTLIALRLKDTLSSHDTPVGANFSAEVTQEISVGGRVVIPAGSIVRGEVMEARPANKIGGRAVLSVKFTELDTPGNDPIAISARLAQSGKSELGKDAAIIGGSTIGGAILGEAIDEGEGGIVGAVVGGIAGTVAAKKTKGKPVVLPAGTSLPITLESAVTIEVES